MTSQGGILRGGLRGAKGRLWASGTIWDEVSARPANGKFRTSASTSFCLIVLVYTLESIVLTTFGVF